MGFWYCLATNKKVIWPLSRQAHENLWVMVPSPLYIQECFKSCLATKHWGFLTDFPRGFRKSMFGSCKSSRIQASGSPHFWGFSSTTSPIGFGKSKFCRFMHQYQFFSAIHTDINMKSFSYTNLQRGILKFGTSSWIPHLLQSVPSVIWICCLNRMYH